MHQVEEWNRSDEMEKQMWVVYFGKFEVKILGKREHYAEREASQEKHFSAVVTSKLVG